MLIDHNRNISQCRANRNPKMQPKKHLAMFVCTCSISVVFIVLGIILLTLWSTIYHVILKSSFTLKPGSTAYDLWKKNPLPLTLKLFVFNWTNPEEIENKNVKPKFQQLGPYTFIETKEKADVIWNVNDTVTYKHLKRWWFDPKESNGSLWDPVTTINPIALAAAQQIKNWHYILKRTVSMSLSTLSNTIYITKPVGQILFGGYEDPLLSMLSKLPITPKNFPLMDKFGWFYARNGSVDYEGTFNVKTGVDGQIGELNQWKFSNHTPYYPGRCGRIDHTSGGDFFPRDLTKNSIIKMFSADLCRFMELEFEREVVINGIVGYKYSAHDRFLDNGTKIPENKCFCDGDCMPSGALNVSNCRSGSPAFVSLPHFRKADPYYLDVIEGLNPKPGIHDMFMIFEPKTGIPLHVSARLQINMRVSPVEDVLLFENVPTFFFPVLYFEQVVTIPESMAFTLKLIVNFQTICNAIGISLIVLGLIMFSCSYYKLCTTKLFGRNEKKICIDRQIKEEVPLKKCCS